MRKYSQHAEWLNLIEKSGPFLVPSVLESAFPQGLDAVDTTARKMVRNAYHEWVEAINDNDPLLPRLHDEWIRLVLHEVLELDDQSLIKSEEELHKHTVYSPIGHESFSPDFLVISPTTRESKLLISIQPPGTRLEKTNRGSGWPVSLMDRMTQLCRQQNVRLGLLTNGAQWMLVNAPIGETSSNTSWFARLWFQEPVTFQAFQSLLGVRRFFGPEDETLEKLLHRSTEQQEEITDTLGEQVRRAVEVLTQCLDKIDADRNRDLLREVPPNELYEAGLTVMMRLVFTMCAEERGLLHLDDPTYESNYAVSSLRNQLEEEADHHGFEVLERKHDAWARLLAVFRAIYGGIEHEDLRLPALGGSLFDPDRFPFLEGRKKGANWKETPSKPLPIDNRTVLLLLSALQVLEQSGGALLLSYKALDVEQIGHVYEGLLEHTVERLPTTTLGLIGSKKAKYPNLSLSEVESLLQSGTEALSARIKEVTLRSETAIKKGLVGEINDETYSKIVAACGGDVQLADRIRPFGLLLRSDAWGELIVYQKESFAITLGSDRRETGTHYTPKSLTENIVETTLEPIVYKGPAEGKPIEEWILKSSKELLGLKICDPAMGSGAFLVQVCRWLSVKVVEAWKFESLAGKFISVDGWALDDLGDREPLDESVDEQVMVARRLVAEKCLYGVDLNPLAVELAKLSIWLITLAKDRPFGFLDHNLRAGDSLLGINKLEQLNSFDLHADNKTPKKLFAQKIDEQVNEVLVLRKQLRETPIRDVRDVQYMERLDQQAREKLEHIEHIADAMIGEALASGGNQRTLGTAMDNLSTWAAAYIEGDNETGRKITAEAKKSLSIDLPAGKSPRNPFHWALEFPEVFESGGFDGVVGNPPFLGGTRISSVAGDNYREYLVNYVIPGAEGRTDLVAYFFNTAFKFLRKDGCFGLLATNTISEGDTRHAGLERLLDTSGATIYSALSSESWPGQAAVVTSRVHIKKGKWHGLLSLNGNPVDHISAFLSAQDEWTPKGLNANLHKAFLGSHTLGMGFTLTECDAKKMINLDNTNIDVLYGFLNGKDLNTHPLQHPSRWVINFWDWDDALAKTYIEPYRWTKDKVYAERLEKSTQSSYREIMSMWWLFWRSRPNLYHALGRGHHFKHHPEGWSENSVPMKRVIAITRHTKTNAFCFVDNTNVFSDALVVIASSKARDLAILQSSIHVSYAWKHGSRLKTDLRYTSSDIFDTFPFPLLTDNMNNNLEELGERYDTHRAQLMSSENIGLTKLYNQFHNPNISNHQISELRDLHRELDEMVSKAYGWSDLSLEHGFHRVEYLPANNRIRFTISESVRIEILKRLAQLNKERYEEEVKRGLHDKKKSIKAQRQAVKQVSNSHQTTFLKDT
jgi:hypothetical protein